MLKIYNSLTQKKEFFRPLNQKVNIYVCGPTVYNHMHLGNIRSLIFFDMFKRYLKILELEVFLVVNITDIDDKIIQAAIQNKTTEKKISEKYTHAFFNILTQLKIDTVNQFPLVTNYISEIISYIEQLIQKGYTYTTEQGIYFKVNLLKDYDILSQQNLVKLKKNIRKNLDDKKKEIHDFILWKKTNLGVCYSSPWFSGRPGWHTECVVMIKTIFGTTIDIHGGGHDLKFPHHANEQAQFIVSENQILSNFFMHIGHVNYKKQKMSKSLQNIILVKDLLTKINPNILKLFFLNHHYRQPINYSKELIMTFKLKYDKIVYILKKNYFQLVLNKIQNKNIITSFIKKFSEIMQDDLNTPNVMTLIEEILKKINKKTNLKNIALLQNTLLYILDILGIKILFKTISQKQISIYYMWQKAKKKEDFVKSDFLRNLLIREGLI